MDSATFSASELLVSRPRSDWVYESAKLARATYPQPRSAKSLGEEKDTIVIRSPETRMSHAKTVTERPKGIKPIERHFARRWPCTITNNRW